MKFLVPLAIVRVFFCSALLPCVLSGCGGGTTGTGTGERSFEGQVSFTTGAPVKGATVTLSETGQSATTDAAGAFSILSNFSGDTVNLAIDAGIISTAVSVDTSANTSAAVSVDVTINADSAAAVAQVSALQVRAQIVGYCDPDFENFRTIQQSNPLPNGSTCSVKVQIYGDGKLLERVPFIIQRSGCSEQKWSTIAQSETGFGVNAGVGTVDFQYFNSSDYCVYRVVAPSGVSRVQSVIYEIDTFLKQTYDAKN